MAENLLLALLLALPCLWSSLLWLLAQRIRRRHKPKRLGTLFLANGLVTLLLLSLLAAGGEVYWRFLADTTESLSYARLTTRWFDRHWILNDANVRDNVEYQPLIAPGKRRVTFVGDSFTAAQGIKNVEDRFVNRIRRAHPGWEVHMMAVLGFDTGHELDRMDQVLKDGYQIDEVVLVYCLNDVSDMMPEVKAAAARLRAEVDASGWLRRNSYLVDTLAHRLAMRRNPFMQGYYDLVRNGYEGDLWERQKKRLAAFRDLVAAHGGRLSVVTFPFVHDLGPNYPYQSVHVRLNRLWAELQVPHLDLLPVFKDLPPHQLMVNRFDAHPNEYAHALATAAIDRFLTERLPDKPQGQ